MSFDFIQEIELEKRISLKNKLDIIKKIMYNKMKNKNKNHKNHEKHTKNHYQCFQNSIYHTFIVNIYPGKR